jgi:oxygen-dependent protoporphyrinogen oxidase
VTRVAIVGGGIAGIAAALRVVERAPTATVTLLEAGTRLGGIIGTERRDGFVVDLGPDSFITEKPWALALCDRLGIAGDLVGTREGDRRTHVALGDRLHSLPDGFLMLAPTALAPLVQSPLFTWRGKLRMALDLVVLPRRFGGDESIADFVRRRLGREALERVADPLLSGIYTGDPERLSVASTMPRFRELETVHGSVIVGLRRTAKATRGVAGARYGLFVAHKDGMGALVDALAARLPAGAVRLGARVDRLEQTGGGWRLHIAGAAVDADAVVLACPAHASAALMAPLDSLLAATLAGIPYASSAIVTLAVRTSDLPRGLPGFGFVVPAVEGRDLLACTFSSRKWAGRAPEGFELLRAFVGGVRRPEMVDRDDATLVSAVRADLARWVGLTGDPVWTRVDRWRQAMPQYELGHAERLATIDARLAAFPRLRLAGNAYRGIGIPDSVHSGEVAADTLLGLA